MKLSGCQDGDYQEEDEKRKNHDQNIFTKSCLIKFKKKSKG